MNDLEFVNFLMLLSNIGSDIAMKKAEAGDMSGATRLMQLANAARTEALELKHGGPTDRPVG